MAFVFGVLVIVLVVLGVLGVRRVLRSGPGDGAGTLALLVVATFVLGALSYKYWTEEASNCSFDPTLVSCLVDQTSH